MSRGCMCNTKLCMKFGRVLPVSEALSSILFASADIDSTHRSASLKCMRSHEWDKCLKMEMMKKFSSELLFFYYEYGTKTLTAFDCVGIFLHRFIVPYGRSTMKTG